MENSITPLEYSEETLMKRLEWIRIINIQGIKDITIKVPKSGIVRLHAPSEVGKSASFKPIEPFVTHTYRDKKSIGSLVNVDAKFGEVALKQLNGTMIGIHLDKEKVADSYYIIMYPDGRRECLPYNIVQPKVLELLGWFTTGIDKLDFSMNVRLGGVLPIVETPKRLTSEIFGVALTNNQVEMTHSKLKESISQIENVELTLQRELQTYEYQLKSLKVENESDLEYEIELLTNLAKQERTVNELKNTLTQLYTTLSRKPEHITVPYGTDDLISKLNVVSQLNRYLEKLINTPKPVKVASIPDLTELIDMLNALKSMKTALDKLEPPKQKPKSSLLQGNLSQEIDTINALNSMSNSLSKLLNLEKVSKPTEFTPELASNLKTLQALNTAKTHLNNLTESISKVKEYRHKSIKLNINKLGDDLRYILYAGEQMELIREELNEIREDMTKYQCPTCGQYYVDTHTH